MANKYTSGLNYILRGNYLHIVPEKLDSDPKNKDCRKSFLLFMPATVLAFINFTIANNLISNNLLIILKIFIGICIHILVRLDSSSPVMFNKLF